MPTAQPTALPPLDRLWRPNCPSLPAEQPDNCSVEDRECIRRFCGIPATEMSLTYLTMRMNELADYSPATVRSIQADIDSALAIEGQYEEGLIGGNIEATGIKSYKGPRFLRPEVQYNDPPMNKADVVEYDTSLLQEEFTLEEGGSISQNQGQRYWVLTGRICQAIGDCCGGGDGSSGIGGGSGLGRSPGIIPLYRS